MCGDNCVTIYFYHLIFIIHESHGTADNFIQCSGGTKTWNIECLVTEVRIVKYSINVKMKGSVNRIRIELMARDTPT